MVWAQSTQALPGAASESNGDFLVAWSSSGQDGNGQGIFAQRFATALATLDIDGNGVVDPLTDGILALRFNCVTRCDAGTILPYLQTLD